MKKIASLVLALVFLFSLAFAEEAPAGVNAFVSITNDENALVLAYEPIFVTDQDNDGAITIADALACAHAAKHENGAEAFAYVPTEYGLSLTLLWGVDNGGSYGYMVNDASPLSLQDAIKEGDHVKAYAFTDLVGWTDTYSFFDKAALEVKVGEAVSLALSAAGYDEMWNPVVLPVEGARVTVNGAEANVATAEGGVFELTFEEAGVYVVSAASENMNLVSPVCVITVVQE
ncbi:MAG: hypothetical protein IJN21_11980 [Clostridia bacterium]|nr:hypothetical protein [Clostridiales bacterium]MBQ6717227.1 hypothetical protein [Clostridia bacterium]